MTNGGRTRESEIAIAIYLGLGSNLGDREANLREAIARIEALGLDVVRESSIYETEPVGYEDQPWFLNQVLEVRPTSRLTLGDNVELTRLMTKAFGERSESSSDDATGLRAEALPKLWAHKLLDILLNIEREMGRARSVANGPRVIDIDLLLCDGFETKGFRAQTVDENMARAIPLEPRLTLPHPRMHLRRFVLEPLCEIAPELMHPVLKKTCRELLALLEDSSVVRLYKERK